MSLSTKNYRWDIQGLRAIAVLAVVLFHINPMLLPGGYIGVDIFFVISGYLIMGFIWRDLNTHSFKLLHFYNKRILRLFPAMFVMLIVTSLMAYLFLLPSEQETYLETLISTLFYYSNFYFYGQSDYFNTAMQFSPLLHTWSLSVEEQFYLIFPLLLILIYTKQKTKIFMSLVLLALVSLILSEILIHKNSAFSFFSSPTRFFQFILGGIIAISFSKNIFSTKMNDTLGMIGLVGLFVIMYFYNDKTPFPGVYALLPTLAMALVLYSGTNTRYTQLVLGNRVFRVIGNASYSIYLWHWPLIVFYKLKVSPSLSVQEQVVLFVLSLVFGYLSWIFVENRTRGKDIKNISFRAIYGMVTFNVLLIVSVWGLMTYYPVEIPKHKSRAYKYVDHNITNFRLGECFLNSSHNDVKFYQKEKCVAHKEGKKNYLLIGDSHAAHYYSAFDSMVENNETLTQVTSSGCVPMYPVKGLPRCTELVNWAYDELIKEKHFDTIVMSGHWGYMRFGDIIETMKHLLLYTNKVVVLGPTMQYRQSLPRLLVALSEDTNTSSIFKSAGKYKVLHSIDKAMASYIGKIDNVDYISTLDLTCTKEDCLMLTDDGIPMNFDESHLTHEGALYILEKAKREIFGR